MARIFFKNRPDKTTPFTASRFNGFFNGEESIEKLVVGDIECKQLFDKNNKNYILNNTFIDGSTKKISSYTGTKTILFPIKDNKVYTISRLLGSSQSFKVALTNETTVGSSVANISGAINEKSYTITNTNYKYLIIWYYWDTKESVSEQQILDSLQIEYGNKATPPTEYKEFSNNKFYYNAGDIIKLKAESQYGIICSGFITNGRTEINCQIPLSKPINSNVSNVTISSKLSCRISSNSTSGIYLIANESLTSAYDISYYINESGIKLIIKNKDGSVFDSNYNNFPLVVMLYNGTISFN